MISRDKPLRWCIGLLACNLVFIWGNSLLPREISGAMSKWLTDLLFPMLEGAAGNTDRVEGPLRKLAHFMEFTSLGLLLAWLFTMLERPAILALALGVTAAAIDEAIQFFVPGRAARLWDVGLDSYGAAFGMILLFLGHTYFVRKRRNNLEETE